MVARRLAGETLASIASDYGISAERVRQLLAAAGLKSGRPRWSAAHDMELWTLWADGLPASVIGQRLQVTEHTVFRRAGRLGLPRRPSILRGVTPKPAPRNCVTCDAVFVPQRSHARFCSVRCFHRTWQQQRRRAAKFSSPSPAIPGAA